MSISVGNPSHFTADFPLGLSYLTVDAEFGQGGVAYYFKLDVRPPASAPSVPVAAPAVPVAAPATPVASHPNFTG